MKLSNQSENSGICQELIVKAKLLQFVKNHCVSHSTTKILLFNSYVDNRNSKELKFGINLAIITWFHHVSPNFFTFSSS